MIGAVLGIVAGWFANRTGDGADPKAPRSAAIDDARSGDASTIRVEAGELRDFVALRTGIEDVDAFRRQWEELSTEVRADWQSRFVREEALVREARSLGLDRDDPLIRRRLVQQMEFLALGAIDSALEPDEAELDAYFAERSEDYQIPGTLRFAHVFLRADRPPQAEAPGEGDRRQEAEALMRSLNTRGANADNALKEGDRFLYQRIYVDRTLEEVESHFGPAMAADLMALSPSLTTWQGPLESDHGWHLVLLQQTEPPHRPQRGEIEATLRADWRRDRLEVVREEAIDSIVEKYRVEIVEPD